MTFEKMQLLWPTSTLVNGGCDLLALHSMSHKDFMFHCPRICLQAFRWWALLAWGRDSLIFFRTSRKALGSAPCSKPVAAPPEKDCLSETWWKARVKNEGKAKVCYICTTLIVVYHRYVTELFLVNVIWVRVVLSNLGKALPNYDVRIKHQSYRHTVTPDQLPVGLDTDQCSQLHWARVSRSEISLQSALYLASFKKVQHSVWY